MAGDKLKIVERSGTRIEDILTRKKTWKGSDCERTDCFLCTTNAASSIFQQILPKNSQEDNNIEENNISLPRNNINES